MIHKRKQNSFAPDTKKRERGEEREGLYSSGQRGQRRECQNRRTLGQEKIKNRHTQPDPAGKPCGSGGSGHLSVGYHAVPPYRDCGLRRRDHMDPAVAVRQQGGKRMIKADYESGYLTIQGPQGQVCAEMEILLHEFYETVKEEAGEEYAEELLQIIVKNAMRPLEERMREVREENQAKAFTEAIQKMLKDG